MDDTPLTGYAAWNKREPNNVGSAEKCAHVYGPPSSAREKWNDLPCIFQKAEILHAPVVLCQKHLK